MMNNVTIVILGASGDLSRRKLFPALYRLIAREHMQNFIIVGAANQGVTVDAILENTKPFITNIDPIIWQKMHERTFYQQLDFGKQQDFDALNSMVTRLEKLYNLSGNRMIYLAASASFYCTITASLAHAGLALRLADNDKKWHRLVYEKPFGSDLESAREINTCINNHFNENQIYRIDHFLTKELVSNIALVRFTNCVFEPLWNNRYIDQVQIVVSELLGIENRGAYYDNYGALADVMQNHILELLALIAMESPEKLSGNYVRDKRVQVLQKIQVVDGLLGQYEGYQQEPHVKKDSTTETFAALMVRINNPRWAGVPFYLKTGKFLDQKKTVIDIKFKQVDCLLTHSCPTPSNWLRIEIYPEAVFSLTLNVKKPGIAEEVISVPMEFCHSCVFGDAVPYAYEVVLQEVMRGENSISVRFDEIEAAWRVIDAVRAHDFPLYSYAPAGKGPQELDAAFQQKYGMRWRE